MSLTVGSRLPKASLRGRHMSCDLREKEPPGKKISQGRNVRKVLTWKNAGISSEKKEGHDGWSIVSRHHICVSNMCVSSSSSSFVFSFIFLECLWVFTNPSA